MSTVKTLKIVCRVCDAETHAIRLHLRDAHPDWTVERYGQEFPGAPLMSAFAQSELSKKISQREAAAQQAIAGGHGVIEAPTFRSMAEVFGFPDSKAVRTIKGDPIMIPVRGGLNEESQAFVPDIDDRYVFDIDITKTIIAGLRINMPTYLWGYHGTGKTTAFEQVSARLNTPFLRVQHTVNTEESHIVGQWTVKDGSTEFSYGPLPLAMLNGYVYCADEYDFGSPAVLSVYQPVLEGKPLVIKEAPATLRIVRPHKDFRFVATGNTNGGGDETGLYQGTQLQNAANFSRFGITEEVSYMEPKLESAVVAAQAGIAISDASKLVSYATEVRKAFKAGIIGSTVSPRELIAAAKLGTAFGCNWRLGIQKAFANRLSRVDGETCKAFAQRTFG